MKINDQSATPEDGQLAQTSPDLPLQEVIGRANRLLGGSRAMPDRAMPRRFDFV